MIDGSVKGFECGFHALMVPSEEADITALHYQYAERIKARESDWSDYSCREVYH